MKRNRCQEADARTRSRTRVHAPFCCRACRDEEGSAAPLRHGRLPETWNRRHRYHGIVPRRNSIPRHISLSFPFRLPDLCKPGFLTGQPLPERHLPDVGRAAMTAVRAVPLIGGDAFISQHLEREAVTAEEHRLVPLFHSEFGATPHNTQGGMTRHRTGICSRCCPCLCRARWRKR